MRRRSLERQIAELMQDTREALVEAQGKVPMTEAARLAGVSRSRAYVLLDKRGDDDGVRGATSATQ
jgi:predicted HTH domain antitoxin